MASLIAGLPENWTSVVPPSSSGADASWRVALAALTQIAPGRGRRVTYGAERVNQIVQATTQTKPPGATHWSTRTMAKAQGLSKATVQRIW